MVDVFIFEDVVSVCRWSACPYWGRTRTDDILSSRLGFKEICSTTCSKILEQWTSGWCPPSLALVRPWFLSFFLLLHYRITTLFFLPLHSTYLQQCSKRSRNPVGGLLGVSEGIWPPLALYPERCNPRTAVIRPWRRPYRIRGFLSLVGVGLQTVPRDCRGTLECRGPLKIEMLEMGVMIWLKDFTGWSEVVQLKGLLICIESVTEL